MAYGEDNPAGTYRAALDSVSVVLEKAKGKNFLLGEDRRSVERNVSHLEYVSIQPYWKYFPDINIDVLISAAKTGREALQRPITWGNGIYSIVDGINWVDAQNESKRLGGTLVEINNASENSFIELVATGLNDGQLAWIGLSDAEHEGDWRWSTGTKAIYTNWSSGEPNNNYYWLGSGEDYGVISKWGGEWYDVKSPAELAGNMIKYGIAETPFIRRGDSAYVIVQGPTWEEAEANAVKLGGHLVTINDAEEWSWFKSEYSPAKGYAYPESYDFYPNGEVQLWVGINDTASEGQYKWASGEASSVNQSDLLRLGGGTPSNDDYGVWQWEQGKIALYTNGVTSSDWQAFAKNIRGVAEIRLAPNNLPTGTPLLSGTLKAGQVITIDRTPIQDADNFTGYTPDVKYSWEIANDPGMTMMIPVWESLNTADATDGDETFTITADLTGKLIRGVVSYLDGYGTQESVATAGSSVTSATVVRGNSLYTIVDGPSWTQAEANSVKLGGHLVSIQSEGENQFLNKTFVESQGDYNTNQGNHLWIGATDDKTEGNWRWIDGSPWNYTNWASTQPDNALGGENFGSFLHKGGGRWIDARDNYYLEQIPGSKINGIAETAFIRRGDSAYVIVQGPTWEEAEANAVKLGGHLVTINDAAENEWISKQNWQSNRKALWIGASDKEQEGLWKWADGANFAYSNWGNGEPNGGVANEDYGQIPYGGEWDGKVWNDDYNGDTRFGFATNYGIAEIKLAPNNNPTGSPTLSGTTKVGQVITIDKTPIQDTDNFTGFTPDFKYSWEVSTNGTTWTPLTTTDATDNNSTYTLTTAEFGKQVRGVVSYLDGYGTQESINSAASVAIASSAPPVQSLTLTAPGRTTLRSGTSTTTSIAYTVSTGEKNLTGIGASLYFDSTQLAVTTAGDPFQKGLIGNQILADTNNADGDPKTDKVLALAYADFGADFPGSGTTLPLTLANLNLVPTSTYSGTTLHLKANNPSTGFTATGSDLTLAYNAAPTVNGTIPALTTNRGKAFFYTVPSTLFSDADSTLTLSASTSAGTPLPSWLSFNAATRTLSGTPTTGGTLNLNINAADELGSVSAPLTLKVREVQQLSSSSTPLRYQRNKDLTVPINYSTSDASSSTGLAFKVHFNSSLFSFDPSTGVSNKAQADLFQVGAVQLDTTDSDNDPTTDRFIPISIASFSGQFTSGSSPTKLADLTFRTADKAIDPLTGLRDTSINFTETSVASGYGFSGTSATLKPLSFSLDVDRDGKVTALGDGLMIIRHLFGAAFAGDALINKAISPDSPLLGGVAYSSMTAQQKADVAAQVAANIQEGIDSKALDVDKDNKITALGDGLMVIRRLFGAAFDGAALTSKAISPDSPYFGPPADFTAVAANIDALKPTTTTTPVI